MDVKDGLTRIRTRVHNHPVPAISDSRISSQLLGHEKHFPHDNGVVFSEVAHRGDVLSRDDEDVGWRLRMYVPECHRFRVCSDDISRNLSLGDPAKEAICVRHRDPLDQVYSAQGDDGGRSWPQVTSGAIPWNGRRPFQRPQPPWASPFFGSRLPVPNRNGGAERPSYTKEEGMERWTQRVKDILDGAPTRALPLSRLIRALKDDGVAEACREDWVLARLTERPERFRVIPDRLGPWVHWPSGGEGGRVPSHPRKSGPDPWIMTCSPGPPPFGPGSQVVGRIQEGLQAWGRSVDDGSQTAVARWIGANHEATKTFEEFFSRKMTRVRKPLSTNHPPHRPREKRGPPQMRPTKSRPFPR